MPAILLLPSSSHKWWLGRESGHIHFGDKSCLIMAILLSLVCWDQGKANPGDHQEGREVEGDQAHIAATCLPRKGRASHSWGGREQTWPQSRQPLQPGM